MLNHSTKRATQIMMTVPIFIALWTIASFQGGTRVSSAPLGSDGKKIYSARCSICHGVDGSGDTAEGRKLKASDLRGPDVQNQPDNLLMETVMDGTNKMPGFKKKLNQEKIQQVVAYIRELGQKK